MLRAEKEIRGRGEIERILSEAKFGRLGTCVNGEPYVVPLSFVYKDGKIVFHCARRGKKLDNIARNPRVCFEVDEGEVVQREKPCDFSVRYRSVIAHGYARIYTETEKMLNALRLLTDKYALPGLGSQLTAEVASSYGNLAVVEITLDEMTGKKSLT